jgi:hypothetical protein
MNQPMSMHDETVENIEMDIAVVDMLSDRFRSFLVTEPSKLKYLSPSDIVKHFNELNMDQ